jgi:hypothetical protein
MCYQELRGKGGLVSRSLSQPIVSNGPIKHGTFVSWWKRFRRLRGPHAMPRSKLDLKINQLGIKKNGVRYSLQATPRTGTKPMTTLKEFRCEVCGLVTTNPIHWFVIRCGDSDLTVYRWNSETANAPGARHYCGEAHAEVYISRWFDSVCAPPKPSFT